MNYIFNAYYRLKYGKYKADSRCNLCVPQDSDSVALYFCHYHLCTYRFVSHDDVAKHDANIAILTEKHGPPHQCHIQYVKFLSSGSLILDESDIKWYLKYAYDNDDLHNVRFSKTKNARNISDIITISNPMYE